MPGYADIRRRARRDIHAAFAVSATYTDDVVRPPTPLAVRWHDKGSSFSGIVSSVGNISGGDYAEVVENIDKIIFNTDELIEKGISPKRGGTITLTDYGDYQLVLDLREPTDGPLKMTWTVMRPGQQAQEFDL